MLFVAVAVVLVSAASAVEHCCFPSKLSALMLQAGGTYIPSIGSGTINDAAIEINYDYDRQMIAMLIHNEDYNKQMIVINDYKQSTAYMIFSGGFCYTKYLDPSTLLPRCEQGNFTFNGVYTIGSESKTITVDVLNGQIGTYKVYITLTVDDCTPIAQVLIGENDDGKSVGAYGFLYTGVQLDVVNDALFDIPASCNSADSPIGKRSVEDILGRHLPF